VVEDKSGRTVQALLYRGTPDNPAIWPRALRDLPFAAAVMSVAVGPSGDNYEYLDNLNQFLGRASSCPSILEKFDDTFHLAAMAKSFRENSQLHFLVGSGSNQHNQLLLHSDSNAADHANDAEDAHELKEMLLCVNRIDQDGDYFDPCVCIFAGGGHSGVLTKMGRLFLFGWNDCGQLGASDTLQSELQNAEAPAPLPQTHALKGIQVDHAAFGFSHTVVIEKENGRLFAFGDNSRGQVTGLSGKNDSVKQFYPVTPEALKNERIVDVAAGLHHSATVSDSGELITFGCAKFGQNLQESANNCTIGRWRPNDGSRITRVACGRRHTTAIDDLGRIFTIGENRYGQLGRQLPEGAKFDAEPRQVEVGSDFEAFAVDCGWSHTIVTAQDATGAIGVFGWGRNDKGQLGTGSFNNVSTPQRLFQSLPNIQYVVCGSEFTVVVDSDDTIWSCGWNEHGNLATGIPSEDCAGLTRTAGAPVTTTPGYENTRLIVAAGGAHMLAMRVHNASVT
jgi:alpha-tubulin suppressor-like RCC1 family protein